MLAFFVPTSAAIACTSAAALGSPSNAFVLRAQQHPLVYFHSEDCATPAARIKACGDSISDEKTSIAPYGFIVLANGTQGNMFGLHSMKQFHPAHAKGRAL